MINTGIVLDRGTNQLSSGMFALRLIIVEATMVEIKTFTFQIEEIFEPLSPKIFFSQYVTPTQRPVIMRGKYYYVTQSDRPRQVPVILKLIGISNSTNSTRTAEVYYMYVIIQRCKILV